VLQAAEEVLDLAGSDFRGGKVQRRLTAQARLRGLQPLARLGRVALEEVHCHIEDARRAQDPIRFIRLQPALALPPSQRALRNGHETGDLRPRQIGGLLELGQNPEGEAGADQANRLHRIVGGDPQLADHTRPLRAFDFSFAHVLFNHGHWQLLYWPSGCIVRAK